MKHVKLYEEYKASKLEFYDLEDDILDKIPDDYYYHGSKNISWFSDVENIDTLSNTANAKSQYLFLTPVKRTALNYSLSSIGMETIIEDDSGIICFAIKSGSKKYELTEKDFNGINNHQDMEDIYNRLKEENYDYLVNTMDGKNVIILKNSILEFIDKKYNLKK